MVRHRGDLRRRPGTRKPKRCFYIFCEGRNTEPDYFRALKRHFPDALIEIRTKSKGRDPETLARAASSEARRVRTASNSFEQNDQVWAVFDHDGREDTVHVAREMCRAGEVGIGFSNPCFEIWLLLHRDDYDKAGDSKQVQKALQHHLPGYDRARAKTADFKKLLDALEDAENRAVRQLARREAEGCPNGVPSTTVVHLTRAIAAEARRC